MQRVIRRSLSTVKNISAQSVFEKSCYNKIDFKISEDATAYEASIRFSAFNIGCLAVVQNESNKVIGVVSERDLIHKVISTRKNSDEVKIKEICTSSPNIIASKQSDSLDDCMNKMMFKGIKHLMIVDDKTSECTGMISIRDVIKEVNQKNKDLIMRLSDFNIGKGAYFSSE